MWPTHPFIMELDPNDPPPPDSPRCWDMNWAEACEVRLALEEALRESKARKKAVGASGAGTPS